MGSAKATLTEEAFSALTGSDKKIKIESVKQEKKAEKSEQTEQKKLSKLTVVLALAVILPLGYIILVVIFNDDVSGSKDRGKDIRQKSESLQKTKSSR